MRPLLRFAAVLAALLVSTAAIAADPPATAPTAQVLVTVQSDAPIAAIGERLAAAAKAKGYGVVTTHDMQALMAKRGVTLGREVLVFEICNPGHAKTVLTADVAMATVLPCRIAAWVEGGRTVLSMVAPSQLLALFPGAPGVAPIAAEVERDLRAIMKEAAAGERP